MNKRYFVAIAFLSLLGVVLFLTNPKASSTSVDFSQEDIATISTELMGTDKVEMTRVRFTPEAKKRLAVLTKKFSGEAHPYHFLLNGDVINDGLIVREPLLEGELVFWLPEEKRNDEVKMLTLRLSE